MKIDRQSRQSAKKYFRACLKNDGSLNEQAVRDLVHLLVTEKPRNYLSILRRLLQLIEIAVAENSVSVESASPLPDEAAAIFADLEQRYGMSSSKTYKVNPSLLGGLIVRRGSSIWDGSIRGRLARLEQAFS
jgi:F-type H+-transporting ATPase subunit delta